MNSTLLQIPGIADAQRYGSELAAPGRGSALKVTQKTAVRLGRARDAAAGVVEHEFKDDDVLELELEGGVRVWLSFAQFQRDFPGRVAAARDGAGSGAAAGLFPVELPVEGRNRGLGNWVIETLRVLDVDLPATTALGIAALIEGQLKQGPGLFRCVAGEPFALQRAVPGDFSAAAPALVFIHGTASSTEGSFDGLWAPEQRAVREELFKFYDGRVFALEHRTLTESPVANALALLEAIPANTRLHLVSHSRGGLVGELICLAKRASERAFDPLAAAVVARTFADDALAPDADTGAGGTLDRSAERAALARLATLLAEKQPTVERFVRVACPARGTTLASGRLDRWLSVLVNVLSLAGMKSSPAFSMATDFLLAVAKQRTDPRTLPGLEAQMPDSPLVALLNHPGYTVEADLTVIAGDAEGGGFWDRLKLLVADGFYQENHDLIVNTRAMYGGAPRAQTPHYFFDQGPTVNHFHYFKNPETTRRLLTGLLRREGFADEFAELPAAMRTADRGIVPAGSQRPRGVAGPLPVVFVLPGIMGSQLTLNGDTIWLDPLELALGGMAELNIDQPGVQPGGLIGAYYGELVADLAERGHEVVAFPFDWRRSLAVEATRLAEAVKSRLEQTQAAGLPLRILAHSMGGLVARVMFAQSPKLWARFRAREGARFVMLGTANAGSYAIPQLLLGREDAVRMLAMIDCKHTLGELLGIIARFPGVLEMLPRRGNADVGANWDFFGAEVWDQLLAACPGDWEAPVLEALAQARATLQLLDNSPVDAGCMVYVAGQADETPCGLELVPGAVGPASVRFVKTARGDGKSPWDTSVPAGVKPYLVAAAHGDLPRQKDAFAAYQDLLLTGETARLPLLSAAAERGGGARDAGRSLLDQPVGIFPTGEELTAQWLGAAPPVEPPQPHPTITVTVTHGDLAFTPSVVLVGHYRGDNIVSAENQLDDKLDGRLRERERLGMYPGELGTTAVFLKRGVPGGAVVIGLGDVGSLTAGALTQAVTHGAVRLALAVLEAPAAAGETAARGCVRLPLSTLLVGTGAGGIAIEESVRAILAGVRDAGTLLERAQMGHKLAFAAVEFIELHEDQAIAAARVLTVLATDPQLSDRFKFDPLVKALPGGAKRAATADTPGWWDRLRITSEPDGTLRYDVPTKRARAEVKMVATQRALVDQFVNRSISNTNTDTNTARTLFELLVPNELKDLATGRGNLVLVLNEDSARYPWELLENREDATGCPLAVAAGVVRQLEVETDRAVVVNATTQTALVVGDPVSDFPRLSGAEAEAGNVAATLSARGYTVNEKIRRDAAEIIRALFEQPYRILHLAGHGVYEFEIPPPPTAGATGSAAANGRPCETKPPKVTGMVLGNGVFLTSAEVEQMRPVPEMVFLNCCHLGRIAGTPERAMTNSHRLAANLAAQFIKIGVRVVVAAGWAVDDAAASTFAVEFYAALLRGKPFGEAVRTARERTHAGHPRANTWGAYQCYGDPAFQLHPGGTRPTAEQPRQYVHEREVVVDAENLAGAAVRAATAADLKNLQARARQLASAIPKEWLTHGEVSAALGLAFGELRLFPEAIDFLQQAVTAENGRAPLWVLEQLSHLQARHAVEIFPTAGQSSAVLARGLIDQASKRLKDLLRLGETSERFSLLGGVEKRRAALTRGKARATALAQMGKHYGDAYQKIPAGDADRNFYAWANWTLARVLADLLAARDPAALRDEITTRLLGFENRGAPGAATNPTFWSLADQAYVRLLQHLAAGTLATGAAEVSAQYLKARERGATAKQIRSVLENLDFIGTMLTRKSGPEETVQALREIRRALGGPA